MHRLIFCNLQTLICFLSFFLDDNGGFLPRVNVLGASLALPQTPQFPKFILHVYFPYPIAFLTLEMLNFKVVTVRCFKHK